MGYTAIAMVHLGPPYLDPEAAIFAAASIGAIGHEWLHAAVWWRPALWKSILFWTLFWTLIVPIALSLSP